METVAELLDRAEELLVRGDYGAVVALLEPVQEAGNPEVLYTLGLACYRLEKYQEAINHLNQSLILKPDYVLALARRGLAYQELEQKELATADFEQALTIDPQDHHDWRGRGIAFGELKQYEEEIASYDKAIEIKPDFHHVCINRGIALGALGRYEEAIVSYDKAIEIKPDKHEAWFNRGVDLGALGRYKEAIVSYDKAIEIKPDKHEAWYGRGVDLGALDRYEEAIASYDKAIEIKPDFHEAWYIQGNVLVKLGRYKEGIASFDKAIEIKPDFHEAWFSWEVCDKNQWLSFSHWLKVQHNCEYGLQRISFEKQPMRHLVIWRYYLWVCIRTRSPQEVAQLVQEADKKLTLYLAQINMTEWQEQRLREEFSRNYLEVSSFRHLEISTLVQTGELEKGLKLAEEHRNFRMSSLINGQGYDPMATTFQQAQQLLTSDTAIIYWHYSLVGLTTFILKPNQPPQILPPPPAVPREISLGRDDAGILEQIQALERWIAEWKQEYINYGNIPPDQNSVKKEHPWQTDMKRRLDSPLKSSGSLKLILNIKQLIDEHLQNIKNLILIPHRDMYLLPLHSLFPFSYTTTYLPSLQIGLNLQSLPIQPATKPLLNLHQPTNSPYLELTKNILGIFNSGAKTEKIPNLNKNQFLQLLQENHQALQFTGHGCHDPETPENSYLNLGEDKLLLTDILRHQQLDLSSYRLICLTACESGITTQSLLDEYIGWSSAFLAKKARAVISTLWNVDVRSSAFLMIRFYQLFSNLENPLSAPQALRQAQYWLSTLDYEDLADWYTELAHLIAIPQYRDYLHTEAAKLRANSEKMNGMERPFINPYHWAGFICTGLL